MISWGELPLDGVLMLNDSSLEYLASSNRMSVDAFEKENMVDVRRSGASSSIRTVQKAAISL